MLQDARDCSGCARCFYSRCQGFAGLCRDDGEDRPLLVSLPGALLSHLYKLASEFLTLALTGEGGGVPPHHWLHEHARASPQLRRNHGL